VSALALTSGAWAAQEVAADFSRMSLEELGAIEITSVSKRAEPLNTAPAAIYVITNEDIRRSGATLLPDMLRMAPNLQVAKVSSRSNSVTARGFALANSNKLLVLIDGRSAYSPLDSAVFWDSLDVMPEDIDRIEVVSGPGGTLWGANAVNGVINVITRNAADSTGLVASGQAGPNGRDLRARYGLSFGDGAAVRVYAKGFERDSAVNSLGNTSNDSYANAQGGFRMDAEVMDGHFTFQGDLFDGTITAGNSDSNGHNLLGRWSKPLSSESALDVQAYYAQADRKVPGSIGDKTSTYDIDIKHSFAAGAHALVWGGGYRLNDGVFTNIPQLQINPAARKLKLANVFVQDSLALSDAVKLTAGLKLENSSYVGTEFLPSARLSWQVTDDQFAWAAVSRAVRTPSRVDRELFVPSLQLVGNLDVVSEKLIAYEVGYRTQLAPNATLSVSAYYNTYDDLRTIEFSPSGTLPLRPGNGVKGNTYGIEAWATYSVSAWWRLDAGFNAMGKDLKVKPGNANITGIQALGNDPDYQASLRSRMNLRENVEFDVALRGVAERPNPALAAYAALDARLGVFITDEVEVYASGINMLDNRHAEFGTLPGRVELPRTFYIGATWKQ